MINRLYCWRCKKVMGVETHCSQPMGMNKDQLLCLVECSKCYVVLAQGVIYKKHGVEYE